MMDGMSQADTLDEADTLTHTAQMLSELSKAVEVLDPILLRAHQSAERGEVRPTLAALAELREAVSWLRWALVEGALRLAERSLDPELAQNEKARTP